MTTQTIQAYIDQNQLIAQKNNNYSLYLAKMVNGVYTVVWQSMGPIATVGNPSYEYSNTFDITIPSYNVNYTNSTLTPGMSFTSGGINTPIGVGQEVNLDKNGIFSGATQGASGVITVNNDLGGNPHEILLDASGNNVYVNTLSGMDIGPAVLTPKDTYQIWFESYQETGTIIAQNTSNVGTVSFSGQTEQIISYDASGQWIAGPLSSGNEFQLDTQDQATFDKLHSSVTNSLVEIVVALTPIVTVVVLAYLANNIIKKFSGNLKPTKITANNKDGTLTMEFSNNVNLVRALLGGDVYISSVNSALMVAKSDQNFKLTGESWSISEQNSNLY